MTDFSKEDISNINTDLKNLKNQINVQDDIINNYKKHINKFSNIIIKYKIALEINQHSMNNINDIMLNLINTSLSINDNINESYISTDKVYSGIYETNDCKKQINYLLKNFSINDNELIEKTFEEYNSE